MDQVSEENPIPSSEDSGTKPRHARAFIAQVDRALSGLLGGLLPEEKRYWILVLLTAVASGLVSVAFVDLLAAVQGLCWGEKQDLLAGVTAASPWHLVIIPVFAGLLVAGLAPLMRAGNSIEGTSGLIESLAVEKGKLPFWRTLLNGAVSIIAVGAGASLGREGALIQSGAAFGSWVGEKFRLKEAHVKVLLACGAAGGISAAYNAPIGGSVFAMEVLLGSFALELFGPIIICSVISTAIARGLVSHPTVYVIPTYEFQGWEIGPYVVLGILLGAVSAVFIAFFSKLDVFFRWFQRLDPVKPIIAMAALGAAGIYLPDLFGNGFGTVNSVLAGTAEISPRILLVLPLLKMFFTALCRSSGIPGGLFTPSLFVGAVLGVSFGIGLDRIVPTASPPGAYGLIGMGAILAGTMKAPITAILLVFELTGDSLVILPIMAASIASTLVCHLLVRGSIFTEPLRRRGIFLPDTLAPSWLREPRVEEFMNPSAETVHAAERFEVVCDKFLHTPLEHDRLYVVDRSGAYLGAISLHEIKLFFRESAQLDPVIAIDVLDASFPFVYASDPVSRALEILAESDAERLPVIEAKTRKLLGSISKRQLLSSYRMSTMARVDMRR